MVDVHPSTYFAGFRQGELYRHLLREHLPEAECVVAVGDGVARDLERNFGVSPEQLEVIPYSVDLAEVRRLAQEPVEPAWLQAGVPLILFVGRLEAVKGLDGLLRAVARVRERTAVRCVIVGEGVERERLEHLARELGIGNDVSFTGRQGNPFKYMKRATVLVLPSLSEGLPNVLIEALACGCPVIASDVASGGCRDVLKNGEHGLLVPPGNAEALAAAILDLVADEALRERLSRTGPTRAAEFDSPRVIGRYVPLLLRRPTP